MYVSSLCIAVSISNTRCHLWYFQRSLLPPQPGAPTDNQHLTRIPDIANRREPSLCSFAVKISAPLVWEFRALLDLIPYKHAVALTERPGPLDCRTFQPVEW